MKTSGPVVVVRYSCQLCVISRLISATISATKQRKVEFPLFALLIPLPIHCINTSSEYHLQCPLFHGDSLHKSWGGGAPTAPKLGGQVAPTAPPVPASLVVNHNNTQDIRNRETNQMFSHFQHDQNTASPPHPAQPTLFPVNTSLLHDSSSRCVTY